jgi:hypothetical protein
MSDVISKLNETVGQTITDVIAGGANGSIINLEIDHRYLLTIYCVWRLERAPIVLTGSNESPDLLNGDIPREMKKLLHDEVESVFVSDLYDLKVRFTSSTVLSVFCDVTPHYTPVDYDENWTFCDQQENSCFVINQDFQVTMSKYRSIIE